jgi:prefoldin subunit 5
MADRMQSLLSQAVEDQRSEQRHLAVALTEVRGQLARIAAEIEGLRSAPPAAGGGVGGGAGDEAIAAVSRDLREAVRMLADRLDAVGRSVQERGADIAEMKVAVEDLNSAVRGHTGALAGVNQALAAVPAVGERVGGLQDNLVSLHDRLNGLEEVVAAVDRLGQRIESADQDLRELRSAFAGMASRMAELPSRADLGMSAAQSTESLDMVGGRVARIESALPELFARIDGLREHVATAAPGAEGEPGPAGPGGEDLIARLDAVDAALVVLGEQLTAATEAPDDEGGADPVADQLAELTDGLFGEDGLVARLEGTAVDEEALDRRISDTVQAAVSESEQRLSAHMDEAVLALAEALFRTSRRPGRAAPPAPVVPAPATVVPAPDPEPEPADELDEEYDEEPPDEDSEEAAEPADETDEAEEADEAEAGSPAPASALVSEWQLPNPQPAGAGSPVEEAKPGRRRPWWRPGD